MISYNRYKLIMFWFYNIIIFKINPEENQIQIKKRFVKIWGYYCSFKVLKLTNQLELYVI